MTSPDLLRQTATARPPSGTRTPHSTAPHAAAAHAAAAQHALEVEIAQLRAAIASRAGIEQAKGILMLLMGCGEQVAFELLTHMASHTHRKVRDLARALTESAAAGTALPADVRAALTEISPPVRRPA